MKKVFTLLTIIGIVLLMSACGKKDKIKYINCTYADERTTLYYNIGFNEDVIEEMGLKFDMTLEDYNDSQINAVSEQDYCEVLKKSMPQYKDAFDNCKQKIENKHLLVTSDLIVDKIAASQKDKMGSIEATKDALEQSGYTCEIK